ncbi:MAG TPA: glycine--tRNA ligase [Candidatus Bathyarchaeia archaeon]|nr:glycine--tRNA ligase [Candidatus Bathyarchaeia archaeon]
MQPTIETIAALCKRRGFIYPSADIYGGLNGVYDTGHLGHYMKENIRASWKKSVSSLGFDVLFFEGALLGPYAEWEASGHISHFHDPMVDCLNCKKRYRADDIDLEKPCPHCGKKGWTDVRQFNMMFETHVGASQEHGSVAYLRPETAQSIFVQFKNVLSTNRVKVPFGIAQIGKAFRNEITPKQFLFRMREFEQMELEFFCKEQESLAFFETWQTARYQFFLDIGINPGRIRLRSHRLDELAHYSTRCTDVEYEFPFGWKELEGIAHRGNFDLTQHSSHSGKDLAVFDDETKQSYLPHVVECSVGVDRLFLTLLFDAYKEERIENEETRVLLSLKPSIAPIKAAFFPLVKKLSEPIEKLYQDIKKSSFIVDFDESGSIGKRYRRHDEIGTPVCFTYDFDSEKDGCVTARNRDSGAQERLHMERVFDYIKSMISS